jgi:CopG family nickel-responsive transcriptional regulator
VSLRVHFTTLHVHVDHDRCPEVIVMRERGDELKRVAGRPLATRGVTHGGIEIIADDPSEHGGHAPPAGPNHGGDG